MTARIIDGKARAERATEEIKAQIATRVATGRPPPGLAVVLVGENPASQVYVRNKRRTTEAIGMKSYSYDLPETVSQHELLELIGHLNADPFVHGILVQLPLPKQIDADAVTESIDPAKDVDGLHPYNMGRLVLKRPALRPCTPQGCMVLIRDTGVDLVGKHAVIIGQSNIVGRPMALELLMARCTVTICHSATVDLPAIVGTADILVAAMGKLGFVQGAWIKPGAIVIDVGTNRTAEGKLRGDVDFFQRPGDLIGDIKLRRLCDLVPEHRAGLVFTRQLSDDPGRRSLAQHQLTAQRVEAFLQGPQRLRQPPARRAAKRARARRTWRLVEGVETNHRLAGRGGGMQGGVIGKAEIVAKPDDAGGSDRNGHQAVNSGGVNWAPALSSTAGLLIANWLAPKV